MVYSRGIKNDKEEEMQVSPQKFKYVKGGGLFKVDIFKAKNPNKQVPSLTGNPTGEWAPEV